jgi:uncharacterized membrane protein
MTDLAHLQAPLSPRSAGPVVRTVTVGDLGQALSEGWRDFLAAPQFGVLFGSIYVVGGLLIVLCTAVLHTGYLVYPLAAGFAMIGPLVAVGPYEVSRRRETGEPLAWRSILRAVTTQGGRQLGCMAFVTLFLFIIWMYQVRLLLALFLGLQPIASLERFVTIVLTTQDGLMFLAVGHVVGAALALVAFSLTVVSLPLLVDRDVDCVTAMITSVQAVIANPRTMLAWGLVVAALLVLAMLPLFLGLLVVLPVLGHATWRLYRRVVAPA